MRKHFVMALLLLAIKATAQQPELVMPVGHNREVLSAQYSPDGKYIVTASVDNTAKIWESATGKLLRTLEGQDPIGSIILYAQFSPDGKYIVTAGVYNTKIWESVTGKLLHTLEGFEPQYSPDGKYIITSHHEFAKILESSTGRLIHTLKGHTQLLTSIQFSPDGRFIVTASNDSTVKIWESVKGQLIQTLEGHTGPVTSVQYSMDGKFIVTKSKDNTVRIWESSTGKLLQILERHTDSVISAHFSPDGKYIVTTSLDNTSKIWESPNGKLLHTLKGYFNQFSQDGKYIITGSRDSNTAEIWESATGKLLQTLEGNFYRFNSHFSPDGKYILTTSDDNTAKIWERHTGRLLHTLGGHTYGINFAQDSPDGKYIITTCPDNTAKIWENSTGKLIHTLKRHTDKIRSVQYSPDGKYIITISLDSTVKIWESISGKLLRTLEGDNDYGFNAQFSPDGKYILTSSDTVKIWESSTGKLFQILKQCNFGFVYPRYSPDGKYIVIQEEISSPEIWESATGKLLYTLEEPAWERSKSARFSPDGKYIVTVCKDHNVRIWETGTGSLLQTWVIPVDYYVSYAQYSPDGKYILTTSTNNIAQIWQSATGKLLHTLEGQTGFNFTPEFSPDGKYIITTSEDNTARIWESNSGKLIKTIDIKVGDLQVINWKDSIIISLFNSRLTFWNFNTGEELISLITVDSTDWVVTHTSGLFDASPGAMEKMYFVQGLEVIELSQLKERYYEPGLWGKVMGTVEGELRDVKALGDDIPLFPDIILSPVNKDGTFTINLRNQGGGMGRVKVLINNKELTADARGTGFNPQADSAQLEVSISGDSRLIPGADNIITMVAYNGENWVASRGVNLIYSTPPENVATPSAYIVSIGISDYTGDALDLKYAAKDASDMAFALQTGAEKLFGKENTHLWHLVAEKYSTTGIAPTKENILAVFDTIQKMSEPNDVLMVYISGHGLNLGGQDGDFYYLTKDAYSGNIDAYNDMGIRNATTISSTELVEKVKEIPALKQVLILDACHSGKTVENLMVMREVSSSSLRALDRMKDRTGMYIITGCTADAVSYEASRYGQGVLTYSLLEGIKGASLREDRFIDVNRLFSWASDRVPVLAEGVGGIQRPMIFSPANAQSFDIGELDTQEKEKIPLAKSKPMFLQSMFMESSEMDDIISIGKIIDEKLLDMAGKGKDATIIFIETREFPQAYRINGQYSIKGNDIELKANLRKGKELISAINLSGTKENVEELADKIITEALKFGN